MKHCISVIHETVKNMTLDYSILLIVHYTYIKEFTVIVMLSSLDHNINFCSI